MPIHTAKNVYDPIEPEVDGLRILATRFWPRGVKKDAADLYLPDLAPSKALVQAFKAGEMDWRTFKRRYRAEMKGQTSLIRTLASEGSLEKCLGAVDLALGSRQGHVRSHLRLDDVDGDDQLRALHAPPNPCQVCARGSVSSRPLGMIIETEPTLESVRADLCRERLLDPRSSDY